MEAKNGKFAIIQTMTETTAKKVTPLLFDTYMTMVENSIGTNMFRTAYAEVDGERKDVTLNGGLSCAFFVSSVLTILKLIKEIHITVAGTVRDLENSGWVEIQEPRVGAVIVWKVFDSGDGDPHPHIGFSLGEDEVISNSKEYGYPIKHKIDHRDREVEKIFWHEKLNQ